VGKNSKYDKEVDLQLTDFCTGLLYPGSSYRPRLLA